MVIQFFFVILIVFSISILVPSAMQLKQPTEQSARSGGVREEQHTSERTHDQEYNYQYYEEYKRLYQTSYLLSIQLSQLTHNKQDLCLKIARIQKKTEDFKDEIRGETAERKKRFRRTAQEIQRRFICQVERCNKQYGSDGSLQQHIKLKHPELYESKSHPRNPESQHSRQ